MLSRLLACCCLAWGFLCLPCLQAAETFDLSPLRRAGDLSRVTAKIEVGGDLKVMDQSKLKLLKMSVVGNMAYDEVLVGIENGQFRGLRYYDQAEATLKIDNGGAKPSLRADRRLVAVDWSGNSVELYSPNGPLTRDELDLIDLPGNTLLLDSLLPENPVASQGTWKISEATLAPLLGLDAVSTTDVQATLSETDANTAKIDVAGNLAGAVQGVATEIELKGRLHFDLKARRITYLGLAIKEKRSIGHVQTGLDVVARLQINLAAIEKSPKLTAVAIANLGPNSADNLPLALDSSAGGFTLLCDRRWHLVNDDPKLLSLRFVDRGDLVAQCNVAVLDKSESGKPIDLSKFQSEIQQKLGDNFGQFLQASESVLPSGGIKYRVVAVGKVAELPIEWRYYLVADPNGRQLAMAFTLEQSLVERFGDADQVLARTLSFHAKPETAAAPTKRPTK